MFFSSKVYPTQILISLNPSNTSNFVKAIPSMLDKATACFTKTASNQPQRLCLPVTVPNS